MNTAGQDIAREGERQQALLRAILHRGDAVSLQPWLFDAPARCERGLAAYRANLQGSVERALAAAYPVLVQMLGDDSFAGLARAHLHAQPPQRGDLAWYGEALPAFIAGSDSLAEEPYLADVARLEWALHRATDAADDVHDAGDVPGLARLGDTDPAQLGVRFAAGSARVDSVHPVVTIWQAHQAEAGPSRHERFVPVRQALAEQRAETAWVWRAGWRPRVARLAAGEDALHAALLAGRSLAHALSQAQDQPDFNVEAWLTRALREGWLAAIDVMSTEEKPS